MNTRKRKINMSQPPDTTYTINARICRLVSEYPCIYDRSDANFSKTKALQNVWKEIGKKVNIPPKICHQRWRNMRNSYARSIREHSGATTYYLNNELEFLQKYITPGVPVPPKSRRSTVKSREEQQDRSDEDLKPEVEAISEVKHAQRRNRNEPEDVDTSSPSSDEVFINEITRNPRGLPKKSKENVQVGPSFSNRNAERPLDFDEAFLLGLRPEINQMNFTEKLYFKRRVYDLLGEIFANERATPNANSEVVNESVSAPSISTPMQQRFGSQLQMPRLTPKPQKYL
ncbi:hypothetical protein KR054_011123 [Drosophila jambulina]|nr:hypothetical protein KR054_011123 [Drosophila jambulina]